MAVHRQLLERCLPERLSHLLHLCLTCPQLQHGIGMLNQLCTCCCRPVIQNANVSLAQSPASWVCREKSFMLGILGKEPSEPVELLLPKIAFSILICTNWQCSVEPHPVGTAWQPLKGMQ